MEVKHMLSIHEQVRFIDQLLHAGEKEHYLAHLKRLIDSMLNTLREDLDLEVGIHWPPPHDAGINPGVAVLLRPIYEQMIFSGDPDGAPARALLSFKQELAQFHLAEADRLKAEVARIQRNFTTKRNSK
jgi:hypothetical protein